jgi:hypothetical protein
MILNILSQRSAFAKRRKEMRRMVREERKEMIRRELLSKIKFKKKSAPQMKNHVQ